MMRIKVVNTQEPLDLPVPSGQSLGLKATQIHQQMEGFMLENECVSLEASSIEDKGLLLTEEARIQ